MEGGSCCNSGSSCSSLLAFGDIIINNNHHHKEKNNSSSTSNSLAVVCPQTMMPFDLSPNSSYIAASASASASDHNITHNNNNNNNSHNLHAHSDALLYLPPPPTSSTTHPHHHRYSAATPAAGSFLHHQLNQILHDQQQDTNPTSTTGYYFMDTNTSGDSSSVKARIMAHPHYPRLLAAYLNCQKVGAPAEVVARLEEACTAVEMGSAGCIGSIGEDPALDQFMEAYCEMLSKYEQELTKPFKEAMLFLSRIESQFKAITLSSSSPIADHSPADRNNGSSEDEVDANNFIDPSADDGDLKVQLLRKYSGYLGSLKQEFMKKRKKGKLPKEARQQLMEWWSRHYKWPYPSESQKLALAESTGLDQKQINNWFINQRKRHWKPSEDMQFVVMDAAHQHTHAHHPHHHYLDAVLGNPSFPMDISPSLL